MTKVFIDGSAGTTGLRIHDRLANRSDISLIILPDEIRKDVTARAEALHEADVAFLCLPDAAAVEAVALAKDSKVTLIDTSTAHRTHPDWTYGFAELGRRDAIAASKRIANPGCHASGFVALVAPLVQAGLIKTDAKLSCFSLTGYSGGGKNMIADYQSPQRDPLLGAPRQYALGQQHKHLREMAAVAGLENAPAFCPIVADFYSGMAPPKMCDWCTVSCITVQSCILMKAPTKTGFSLPRLWPIATICRSPSQETTSDCYWSHVLIIWVKVLRAPPSRI